MKELPHAEQTAVQAPTVSRRDHPVCGSDVSAVSTVLPKCDELDGGARFGEYTWVPSPLFQVRVLIFTQNRSPS